MKATEFKATCLAAMDEVAATGDEIVITKHGKGVCKLVPLPKDQSGLWGLHEGRGELLAPDEELFSTGEVWKADEL
jgi:prevent-host-death family protein